MQAIGSGASGPAGLAWIDIVAPAWFIFCWIGYAGYADRGRRRTLMRRMHEYRLAWLSCMSRRDNRILDTQIVSVLMQNIAFFTSSAILIIGGLVAILGSRDQVMDTLAEIPLAAVTTERAWESKVFLLIVTFVYAFFTFTWSLRQFNYVAIMIGATPEPSTASQAVVRQLVARTAAVATNAADYFNKAMRAYYFGLAGLTWFLNPWLFIGVTTWVVFIVWRREFRSAALRFLGPVGESLEPDRPIATPPAAPEGRAQPSP